MYQVSVVHAAGGEKVVVSGAGVGLVMMVLSLKGKVGSLKTHEERGLAVGDGPFKDGPSLVSCPSTLNVMPARPCGGH
jgi:hypothetical protein